MKNKDNKILTEISKLTSKIETDYPELYRFLDENPTTLPSRAHPKVDSNELKDYLQSLRQLIEKHLKTHKKVNGLI